MTNPRILAVVLLLALVRPPASLGQPGRVVGRVTIDFDGDPYDVLENTNDPRELAEVRRLLDPAVGFDPQSHGLEGVVVYLPQPPAGLQFRPFRGEAHVVLLTSGGIAPRANIVRVGQRIVIGNLLPRPELVSWRPRGGPTGYAPVPARGFLEPGIVFTEPEPRPFPFGNGGMLVLDHPYADVTDARGVFEIEGLPPGRHAFHIWHPIAELRTVPIVVEVRPGLTTRFGMATTPLVLRHHVPGAPALPLVLDPPRLEHGPWSQARETTVAEFVGPARPAPAGRFPRSSYSALRNASLDRVLRELSVPDRERRLAASRALASKWGFEEVAHLLVPLALDRDEGVRDVARYALGFAGDEARQLVDLARQAERSPRDAARVHAAATGPLSQYLRPALADRFTDDLIHFGPGTSTENLVALFEAHPDLPAVQRRLLAAYVRPLRDAASFVVEFARHSRSRDYVRAVLLPDLRSDDKAIAMRAATEIARAGPVAGELAEDQLVSLVRRRDTSPGLRARAVEALGRRARRPRVAALLWEVAHDWTRTKERLPAARALLAAPALPSRWQERVDELAFAQLAEYLQAVEELRALLAEQERLRERTRARQLEQVIGNLDELRSLAE